MGIVEFSFKDRYRGWELAPVRFHAGLNLLVGLSGVGKTRLLQCLRAVCSQVADSPASLEGCSWTLTVQAADTEYTWSAEVEAPAARSPRRVQVAFSRDPELYEGDSHEAPNFVRERVASADGRLQLERSEGRTSFDGQELPRLKHNESLVSLLREEASVQPFFQSLRRVHQSQAHRLSMTLYDARKLQTARERYKNLAELQGADLPLLHKALILQEVFSDTFSERVNEVYCEIFPSVAEVRIGPHREFLRPEELEADDAPGGLEFVEVGLRERGVEGWVRQPAMSSGMLRTLFHLFELALYPPATVLLVDEFENSLGVNCLPAVTKQMLDRSHELQFLLTSHHPYVINNIRRDYWMIVQRRGGQVTVQSAAEFPRLQTSSSQEDFLQLMNLLAFPSDPL